MLKDIRKNPVMLTDCYNNSHYSLKPETGFEVSHMYNRAESMILYGFQEIVTDLLNVKITKEMVEDAEKQAKRLGLPFPKKLWMGVVNECGGNIPIKVECVPEGSWCPKGCPFAQISNTVFGYGELVSWFESQFMTAYFPSACATRSFEMLNYLKSKQKQYGYDDSFLWRMHSFGLRGHKSLEDAYMAGTAWSLFLQGTDDFHIAQHMPDAVMGSISALAHKVTQVFESEYECFINAINKTSETDNKIVALVIDTYDAQNVIDNWIYPLASYAKLKGVHLVFRPDSGNVIEQAIAILKIAETDNLNNVSVIIGEGMSFESAKFYDCMLEKRGVPLNRVAYGIGAGFYKDIDRDTLGWAMKTAFSNGKPRMKVVKTNPLKQSIPNRVHLKYDINNGHLVVCDGEGEGVYETIYEYKLTRDEETLKVISEDYFIKCVDETHFAEVSKRALEMYCNGLCSQKHIDLSDETKALITQFQDKYK
jgi:nicotinamide phosphoribosyltransferase